MPLRDAVRMWVPSGDHVAAVTHIRLVSVWVLFPVVVSQIRTVPSRDAVRMWVPSGDHATAVIRYVSANLSVWVLFPVVASQI